MRRSRTLTAHYAIQIGIYCGFDLTIWIATLVRGDQWMSAGARTACAALAALAVALAATAIAAKPLGFYRLAYFVLLRVHRRSWLGAYAMLVLVVALGAVAVLCGSVLEDGVARLVANPVQGCDSTHPSCAYWGASRASLSALVFASIVLLDLGVLSACAGLAYARGVRRDLASLKRSTRASAGAPS